MKITNYHIYTSKKFLGLVFGIDFNVPQLLTKKTYCVIEIKLFFVGFWLAIDEK